MLPAIAHAGAAPDVKEIKDSAETQAFAARFGAEDAVALRETYGVPGDAEADSEEFKAGLRRYLNAQKRNKAVFSKGGAEVKASEAK